MRRALSICSRRGCSNLSERGPCPKHRVRRWSTDGVPRQQRGYGAEWEALRREVIHAEHVCCVCGEALACPVCKQQGLPAQVDHEKAKASGGTDDRDNLRAICKDCHQLKSSREGSKARGGGRNLQNV